MELPLAVDDAIPLDGDAEQELALRKPSDIGDVDRHATVIEHDVVHVRHDGTETPRLGRNEIQVAVAEALERIEIGPQREYAGRHSFE